MDQDSRDQYSHFLLQSRVNTRLVEFRDDGEAAHGVASSTSSPTGCRRSTPSSTRELEGASFGTYNILWQIEQCRAPGLPYLYLGYWIRDSRKMAYKAQFRPIEGFIDGAWRRLSAGRWWTAAARGKLARCSTRLARPLLFRLDPETAHELALPSLQAPAALRLRRPARRPAPPAPPVQRDGPGLPQPGRPRRRPRQERRVHRRARGARLRLPRDRHRHAAPAAGQSEAAPVPPRRARGDHQPHGLQQRRRRPPGATTSRARATAASSASTSARTSTRRSSARPTTTSPACDKVYPHASYVTVNVSSPNTKNLRELQQARRARRAARARSRRRRDQLRQRPRSAACRSR